MNFIYRTLKSKLAGAFAAAMDGEAPAQAQPARPPARARLMALEQRFMFDGAAVATAAHADTQAGATDAAHALPDAAARALIPQTPPAVDVRAADPSRNGGKKEVAFVDTSVSDYKALEAGIRDGVGIVEIGGGQDGLAQMAQWAASQSGYDAIHILSHGAQGKIALGTSTLDQAALSSGTVQAELAEVGHALKAGGDLLVYGCDVGAGDDGQRLTDTLSQLTGADVASSTDASGAAALGGNWTLERATGPIEASALAPDDYAALLLAPAAPSAPDLSDASDLGASNSDNVTTATRPTFTGTAAAGSTVTLYDTDGTTVLGTATADATTGAWSITSTTLSAGDHAITAKAAAGGLSSSASASLVVTIAGSDTISFESTDNADFDASVTSVTRTVDGATVTIAAGSAVNAAIPGDFGFIADNGNLNMNGLYAYTHDGGGVDLTVSADAGRTISLSGFEAGASSGKVTVYINGDPSTAQTFDVSTNGPTVLSGLNIAHATSITFSSDDYALFQNLQIHVDAATIAAPGTPDLWTVNDDGASSTDNVTTIRTPTFSGTAGANDTVTLYDTDGTTVLGSTTANGSGAWAITSSLLANGNHTITAKATDAQGHVSAASGGLAVTIAQPSNETTFDLTWDQTVDFTGKQAQQTVGGDTLVFTTQSGAIYADTVESMESYPQTGFSGQALFAGFNDSETQLTLTVAGGKTFDLLSFNAQDANGAGQDMVITTDKGTVTLPAGWATQSDGSAMWSVVLSDPALQGIAWATISTDTPSPGAGYTWAFDNFVLANIGGPAATPPRATDGNIAITSAGSGTGGTYRIGDTVTATWDNTAAGDNQSGVAGVTFDFSQFGGGSVVVATSDGNGHWTASYTIVSGSIDATNRNVSVHVSDSAGDITTTADSTHLSIDNIAPTVTDGNIRISGASGNNGAYKIGDTVTATWNNTASGDSNADTLSGVTVDFSAFGGGSAVRATNSGGVWTASYTITEGAYDGTAGHNVSVHVTDNAGNVTIVADTTNATVDNVKPASPSLRMDPSSDTGTSNSDGLTSNTRPTFTGTAQANSTVTLYDTDGTTVLGSTMADGAGNWLIIASTLSEGSHTLTAKATDAAGNASGASSGLAVAIDATAPAVVIASNAATLKAGETATITFMFSEDPGATFTAGDVAVSGGTLSGISGSGLTRTATFTPTAGVDGGSASITVAAGSYADAAGNSGVGGALPTLTYDTRAPGAPSTPVLGASSDSGSSSSDGITSVTRPTFTGTAEANSTVTLYDTDGTTVLGTTTADGAGHWTIALTLSEGSHTVTAKATDAAGNVSAASGGPTVTVDTRAPAAPSAPDLAASSDRGSSSTDNLTNATTPTFTGTAEAGSTVTLYDTNGTTVLGTATANGSGAWSITSSTLSEGSHTVTAKATDAAGNVSAASAALAMTIDMTAPSVDSVAVPANGTYQAGDTLDFTVSLGEAVDVDTTGGTPSIALVIGSTTVHATYLGGSGTNALIFSYTVQNGQSDANGITIGSLALNGATLRDKAGNDAVLTLNGVGSTAGVLIDATAPPAPSTPDLAAASDSGASDTDDITAVTTPTFTGTAQAGSTVTLYDTDGTTVLGAATTDGSGNWSITSSTLSEGSHTITATATDASNRVSALSSGLVVKIDTAAPAAPSTPAMRGDTDTGSSNSDGITSNTRPTFTGMAEANSTVTLYDTDGTTVLGSTTADGAGNWLIIASTLSEGSHTLTAKATDTAGNASGASSGLAVVVDTTAPAVVIASNAATLKAGETATITFTFSEDPGATFTAGDVVVSGGTLSGISGSGLTRTATFTPTAGVDGGSASITVAAGSYADAAGNSGAAGAMPTLTFDTRAPDAPSAPDLSASSDSGSSSTDNVTRATTPTFTGTAEANSTVRLYDTDGTTVLGTATADGSGNWSITSTALSNGGHTITAKATDAAGNVSAASAALSVTIDAAAPARPALSLAPSSDSGAPDGITSVAAPTITGTAEAGSTVTLYDTDGTTVLGTATADGAGNWSITSATLSEGSHALTAKAADAAGNVSAASGSLAVTVDATAPAAPAALALSASSDSGASNSDGITNVAAPTVTGTAEAGSTITLYDTDGTTVLGTATANGSGAWSITSSTLSEGNHTITAKATDAAGNVSGVSHGLAVTIDTARPAAPTVAPIATDALLPVLSGTATLADGATMTVAVGGATYAVTPVNGAWTLDLASAAPVAGRLALSAGNRYDVVATITDIAGNAVSRAAALTIDAPKTAPAGQDAPGAPVRNALPPPPQVLPQAPSVPEPPRPPAAVFTLPDLAANGTVPPFIRTRILAADGIASVFDPLAPTFAAPYAPRGADIPAALTAPAPGSAFRVMVVSSATAGGEGLRAYAPIENVSVAAGGRVSVQVDPSAFIEANADATVQLSALRADGTALPAWLTFNPNTGRFEGVPPAGLRGTVSVRVTARDNKGREAVQVFSIVVGAERQGSLPPDAAAHPLPAGRAGVSAQLDAARHADHDRMAALSRSASTVMARRA